MKHTRFHGTLFLLAVLMLCSLLLVPAAAAEIENAAIARFQDDMDGIMITYLGSTDKTQDEIYTAVAAMGEDYKTPLQEIYALDAAMTEAVDNGQVTEAEIDDLMALERNQSFLSFVEMLELADSQNDVMPINSNDLTVGEGSLHIADAASKSTLTASGTTITMKVSASKKTTVTETVTVTNTSAYPATVSFSYSFKKDNSGTYTFSDNVTKDDSTASVYLEPQSSFTVNITETGGSWLSKSATLTLSNVAIALVKPATITVGYIGSASGDSVTATYSYEGTQHTNEPVSDGGSVTSGSATAFKATAASGRQFVAWVDANYNIISSANPYSLSASADTAIYAIFSGTEPWFVVDDTTLVQGWTEAFAAGSKVTLANNATLPAGDYEVASGKTFVVPFDSAGTYYTSTPDTLTPTALTSPTAYRTLTMAEGAAITVNGTMSVPAKVIAGNTNAAQSACRVSGGYGHVAMNSGSSITVKSDGIISVFGYITGSGSVVAESGANVYESFQIADFRGGSATSTMNSGIDIDDSIWSADNKYIFPFSQYYIQNIEVPLTLYSGANENTYTALYMSDTILPTSVTFIAKENAMFSLTSGSLTKQYDKATDRLIIDINGDVSISSISIEIKYIVNVTINSANFPLPITNNMTVNINSGTTTASQDLAFLPGVEINIGTDATLVADDKCDIYVYDLDEWLNKQFVYANVDFKALCWAPNRTYTRTASDLKDATITVAGTLNATAGKIYTTSSGAAIMGVDGGIVNTTAGSTDSTDSTDSTWQATQSGTDVTAVEISINSAWLKNAKDTSGTTVDNDYTVTTGASSTTYVYSSEHGRWAQTAHTVTDEVTDPIFDEKGYTTRTCACGYSYTEDIAVAQVGTTTYSVLKTALDAAAGMNMVTLLYNFGELTISQAANINPGETSNTIKADSGFIRYEKDGIISIYAASIRLYASNIKAGDTLEFFFYVPTTELTDSNKNYCAVITRTKNGATVTEKIPYADWEKYSDSYMRFGYDGIAAKEMADEVTITIWESSAENLVKPLSVETTDSISAYALRLLKSTTNEKLKTALVDMLNYGAAAQTKFGYNTADSANANIDAYQKFATDTIAAPTAKFTNNPDNLALSGKLESASVLATSDLRIGFYFSGISTNMYAVATYTDHYGRAQTQTIQGATFHANEGYPDFLGVDAAGIAAADGDAIVTCTVYDGEIPVASGSGSISAYIAITLAEDSASNQEKQNEQAVCNMLWKFINSAYAYFHAES